jgi:glycosyltransferase involved in cell wall biosynthesis
VGGLGHVVEDGVTGRLVELGDTAGVVDALRDVLVDPRRFRVAARRRCEETFGMPTVGSAWEIVIARATRPDNSRTRILQVAATPTRRGAEMFAYQLGHHLDEHYPFAVRTVAVSGRHADATLPMRVLGPSRLHPMTFLRLIGELRRCDLAVVHGSLGLWPTTLAGAISRRPFVYRSIGDPRFWGGRVALADLRVGLPLRRAATVVALYPASARYMIDRYRLDHPMVETLPNAVDIGEVTGSPTAIDGLPIDRDEPIIAFVGALSAEKRPLLAVEVAALLPDVHLVMAGDGPLATEVRVLGGQIAPGRVHLLGTVTDTGSVYRRAQVTLLTSETEGMPAAVIESVAWGTPVVATAVGSVPDLVRTGMGTVVDHADAPSLAAAVGQIIATGATVDIDLAKAMRHGHSMEIVGRGWADLLSRLTSDASPHRPGTTRW